MKKQIHDLGFGDDFVGTTSKARSMKEKIGK